MSLPPSAWPQKAKHAQASAALTLLLCTMPAAWAQQIIDLAPSRAPDAPAIAQLLSQQSNANQSLHILNMPVDSEDSPTVNLELHRARSVTENTLFVLVDESGQEQPLPADETGAHFSGSVQQQPESSAFVSIAPDGSIRSIVHMEGETIVSQYHPGSGTTVSSTVSRAVDFNQDFAHRSFQCGVTGEHIPGAQLFPRDNFTAPISLAPSTGSPPIAAQTGQRRADIIIDSDPQFLTRLGSTGAAQSYVTSLLTYISQKYQSEISTRLNVSKVVLRNSGGPYTSNDITTLLTQLQSQWSNAANPDSNLPRHHVHLLSGKGNGMGGIAYVGTLSSQYSKNYGYGVSTGISGNFTPSNPQILWDTVVLAHELGHAFGSSHTHAYDQPYAGSNQGGAIDCCYADSDSGQQCAIRNGGAGRTGALPGINAVSGGSPNQGVGTIMSYCHLLPGNMRNMAWSFGTNHPYGVNPGRVPQAMSAQAQQYLPLDSAPPGPSSYTLNVSKTGGGSVTSADGTIHCGNTCSASYNAGTTVGLTATAASGYSFSSWGGACSGMGACNVTMNSNQTVTATFTATASTKHRLDLNKTGAGKGRIVLVNHADECPSSAIYGCYDNDVAAGTPYTLQAIADAGSVFAGWSGLCSGTGTCSFTMPAHDAAVTATFNLGGGGGGGGSGTCQARTFSSNEERILDVFIAYYGRIADLGGFSYWAGELGRNGGDIYAMMHNFGNTPEYRTRFGSMNHTQLVDNLFRQMFGHPADSGGLVFYTNWLTTGQKTLTDIALIVLDGARVTPGNTDALSVENRKKVARHYITKAEPWGRDVGVTGADLSSLLVNISANEASAHAACAQLNSTMP